MKRLALLATVLALAGCGTTSLNTPHAVLERSEIDGETAYQATVDALAAAVSSGKMTPATQQADQLKAWNDLQAFRAAYNAGQDLTAVLATLNGDKTAAQGAQ